MSMVILLVYVCFDMVGCVGFGCGVFCDIGFYLVK